MTAWLLRRLAASVAIVFAVLTLTFILIHLAPGTPFRPSADDRTVSPEVIARLNRVYGLDRPLAVQYLKYIGNVARGEFGESFSQHRPVARALADAVPNTVLLGVAALAIEFALGIALGAYQAARARRRVDAALSHLDVAPEGETSRSPRVREPSRGRPLFTRSSPLRHSTVAHCARGGSYRGAETTVERGANGDDEGEEEEVNRGDAANSPPFQGGVARSAGAVEKVAKHLCRYPRSAPY